MAITKFENKLLIVKSYSKYLSNNNIKNGISLFIINLLPN